MYKDKNRFKFHAMFMQPRNMQKKAKANIEKCLFNKFYCSIHVSKFGGNYKKA